ncbi:hypothetical protein MalM25_01820 [Planctomycetes bacterium MalM25]|nr:hypothetical protein MalM25_01820 [Planctomycetes bacterium MalM25]
MNQAQEDRRFSRYAPILALGVLVTLAPAALADRSWVGPNLGVWSDAGNWSPGGVPGAADIARIGNLPGVDGDWVYLDQDDVVAGLRVTDTMHFRSEGYKLTVLGETLVSGQEGEDELEKHSRMRIEEGPHAIDFDTDKLTLSNGGYFTQDGGMMEVDERFHIGSDSRYAGHGTVRFGDSGLVFRNESILSVNDSADPVGLTFDVINGGVLDLDGLTGEGRIYVYGALDDDPNTSRLTINGGTIADPVNSTVRIGRNGRLQMNTEAPWEMADGSLLKFTGSLYDDETGHGRLGGQHVTLGGVVSTSIAGFGWIESDATFEPTAEVHVPERANLVLGGQTVVNGGEFNVGDDGNLHFGDAEVNGGVFNTASTTSSLSRLAFGGDTSFSGDIVVNGAALQNGDVTVNSPATLTATRFNMNGSFVGKPHWDINHALTLNASYISSGTSNRFRKSIDISGTLLSRLDLNLDDPTESWEMDGEMHLGGNIAFYVNRLAGSPMRMTGELEVSSKAGISADTTLAAASTTTLQDANDQLRFTGVSRVEAGAGFVGWGDLVVGGASGHLTLDDGANTVDVGLVNQGLLDVDDRAGIATVDRFTNGVNGTLAIDLGGHLIGDEFDHLLVAGVAEIDGVLGVDLLADEFGVPTFLPQVGDEFMILSSQGGVSGAFAGVLPTIAGGMAYGWEVLYHPHDVTIRLASVGSAVPEPTTGLMAACLLAMAAYGAPRR